VKHFERLVQLDPESADPHIILAEMYYRTGQHETALQSVDRALELDPSVARAHFLRGVILLALQRDDEAVQAWEQAQSRDANVALEAARFIHEFVPAEAVARAERSATTPGQKRIVASVRSLQQKEE